ATSTITWAASVAGALPTLTYKVTPPAEAGQRAVFEGELTEPGSEFYFRTKGDTAAVRADSFPAITDAGSIQYWLILGPYEQCGGAAPGEELIRRDHLTDGLVAEFDVQPIAGDTIDTRYRTLEEGELCTDPQAPDEAASLSLLADLHGRNPGGVPRWLDWRGIDDDDERIHVEQVYGDLENMMTYALAYLDVEADTTVSFGVASDDSVQVLLDGGEIHINNVPRGTGPGYQDTPFTHPGLGDVVLSRGPHVLMVKVFEGGGDHNFRLGFLDASGLELPFGPEGVEISLTPPPLPENRFTRGDCNGDGDDNISDAIFNLIYQFLGGNVPSCLDACDVNEDGTLNITDPVFLLDFLFKGGQPAPAPYPACDSAVITDCAADTCP
ncbi:MAG: hypothetical protein HY721_11545, partial [Planctomycetes bacterium]|nr:hypothetical protein [Planctomycetota bacterium]